MKNKKNKSYLEIKNLSLIAVESVILVFLLVFFIRGITGGVGSPNATMIAYLTVGTVPPDVLRVIINQDSPNLVLSPNSTVLVSCIGLIQDYNNETDFDNVTARFFSNTSSYGSGDDNNDHYTNVSCNISYGFESMTYGITDDEYTALANCTFYVYYYADPVQWNCSLVATDSDNLQGENYSTIEVNELLALSLPESISYGTVNTTYMSNENLTNVSNAGNVKVNISLKGWAVNEGDGVAMNCTLGYLKNISIEHEKYNLTASTPGVLTLAQTSNYTNLSSSPVVKKFELDYRREDTYNDATNATYWRIYVPLGVAGTCQGNIQFGATKAAGS